VANDKTEGIRSRYRFRFYWRRWLVMLFLSLIVIVAEAASHRRMHIDHNTGMAIWEDREFIRELVLFGLMVPAAGGFLLTFLEGTSSQRDEVTRELSKRRELIKEVNQISRWDQLTNYAVQLPGRIAPALSSQLLVQDPDTQRLKTAAQWASFDQAPDSAPPQFDYCHQCQATGQERLSPILRCPTDVLTAETHTAHLHCLPLLIDREPKAVLRFYLPATQPLTDHQARLFGDLVPELALAFENSLLLQSNEKQGELAIKERSRIARNLHDTLGQNISYLRLKLDQLSGERMLGEIIEIRREIERMRDVANESYEQVRDTLAELHPSSATDLMTTLRQHAGIVSGRAGFAVDWQLDGQERTLKPTVRRNIEFIVREALNNVEKHARAEHVNMSLRWQERDLLLTVADDGIGYSPGQPNGDDHYGISIMHERAQAIDGQLSIQSVVNQGTEVRLRLPLPGNTL
jgi:signal transduction histidine kinase